MTKRAVLYGRVSGNDKSKTDGANLEAQLDLCREYAKRQGYTIIAELVEDDRGASGATFDLPQLSTALDMARSGSFDVLIARELDRLSRDLAKQLIVEQELKRGGVVIEYALYDFPNTPEGRLNKNLRAMLAEYEREKIAQRMKRGRMREVKAGNAGSCGAVPYGYIIWRSENKEAHLAVNEDEARVIRQIFNWYAYGDEGQPVTVRGIAARLTENGIPKPVSRQQKWTHGTVNYILHNTAYIGTRHYGKTRVVDGERVTGPRDEWITLTVPAIIDIETWEAAQERAVSNRKHAHNPARHDYLLQGRVSCAICGYAYTGTTKQDQLKQGQKCYSYYRHTYDTMHPVSCKGSFEADATDTAVWNWLCEKFKDEEALLHAIDEEQEEREKQLLPRHQELESVNTLIAKSERGIARVRKLFYDEHITEEECLRDTQPYKNVLLGLERERAHLEALIAAQTFTNEAKHTIVAMARRVRTGILKANENFAERRRMVDMLHVHCRLEAKDGKKLVHISCVAGEGIVSCDKTV